MNIVYRLWLCVESGILNFDHFTQKAPDDVDNFEVCPIFLFFQ